MQSLLHSALTQLYHFTPSFAIALTLVLSEDPDVPEKHLIEDVTEALMGCRKDVLSVDALRMFDVRVAEHWTWTVVIKALMICYRLAVAESTTGPWLENFLRECQVIQKAQLFREGDMTAINAEHHVQLIRSFAKYLRQLIQGLTAPELRSSLGSRRPSPLSKDSYCRYNRILSEESSSTQPFHAFTSVEYLKSYDDDELFDDLEAIIHVLQLGLSSFVTWRTHRNRPVTRLVFVTTLSPVAMQLARDALLDINVWRVAGSAILAVLFDRMTTVVNPSVLKRLFNCHGELSASMGQIKTLDEFLRAPHKEPLEFKNMFTPGRYLEILRKLRQILGDPNLDFMEPEDFMENPTAKSPLGRIGIISKSDLRSESKRHSRASARRRDRKSNSESYSDASYESDFGDSVLSSDSRSHSRRRYRQSHQDSSQRGNHSRRLALNHRTKTRKSRKPTYKDDSHSVSSRSSSHSPPESQPAGIENKRIRSRGEAAQTHLLDLHSGGEDPNVSPGANTGIIDEKQSWRLA